MGDQKISLFICVRQAAVYLFYVFIHVDMLVLDLGPREERTVSIQITAHP